VTQIRVAAALWWLNGAGFGVFTIPAIRNLRRHQELPMVFGFKAYGGGPFEARGIQTTQWLLAAFLLVNIIEIVAGWLLWTGVRIGAILSFAVLPLAAIFWWGFALPLGPPLALSSLILVILNWSSLH
jgi:hypothetical protein